jgi:hypothetical protein
MPSSGTGIGNNNNQFTGVKVFSATMAQERDQLGEKITLWLKANPGVEIVDKIVTQSSDEAFHCLAITLFYNDPNKKS